MCVFFGRSALFIELSLRYAPFNVMVPFVFKRVTYTIRYIFHYERFLIRLRPYLFPIAPGAVSILEISLPQRYDYYLSPLPLFRTYLDSAIKICSLIVRFPSKRLLFVPRNSCRTGSIQYSKRAFQSIMDRR